MNIRNALLLTVAALSLAACGKTVDVGNAGIMVSKYGGGGVSPDPLSVGFHFTGPGQYVIEYPTTTRIYQWTAKGDGDSPANEEFAFNDSTGLPLTADVSVTMHVDPTKLAQVYTTYKLDFDALRNGPIRSYVRTALALEASKYTSDQLYTSERQKVIAAALVDVRNHFQKTGIEVEDLQWIGSIRFPESVTKAIEAKTRADQEAQVAERQVQVEEARAKAKIAAAQGEAESKRILGEALRANPQVLQQEWIAKWNGALPTYVGNGQTMMMVQPK